MESPALNEISSNKPFHHGMQSTGADIFSGFVHLPGNLGNPGNTLRGVFQFQTFCLHQGMILLGQRSVRFRQNPLKVPGVKGIEFDSNRQSTL